MDGAPVRRRWRPRRLLIILALALLAGWLVRSWLAGPEVPEGSYVLFDLQGDYPEQPPDELVGRLLSEQYVSLIDLVLMLRDAREDSRVAGIVIRVRPLNIGWAKAQDIRNALLTFRDVDKPVIAYLEQEFAPSTLEYYVASAARTIYLPPGGTALLNGLQAQYVFLGGVWEKLDIDMQVEKIREYKTVGDMIARKEMSADHRVMANSLLDSIFAQLVEGVAATRGLEPQDVRAAIDASPATAEELQARRLVDGAKFLEDLRVELSGADGDFVKAVDFHENRRPPEKISEDEIAIVYGVGTVDTGESQEGITGGAANMGADTMGEAFREATANERVKAIVFRVDSPGGSALASDLIWRATQRSQEVKPVIVSMSDVAGSGGYYVAAGARRIVAQPATLTGSIGVVVMKPNVSGLLAKLGVNTESLARGELAELTSLTKSLGARERVRVIDGMNHVYDLFVTRVAEGRGLSPEQVNEVGRGRVWTGEQAKENGLVDELGGFLEAINAAKQAAGIPLAERVRLISYPKPKGLIDRLVGLIGARTFGRTPTWWPRIRAALTGYEFPSGSILTLMPQHIEIR